MTKIFISYRREDSAGYAGRLFDRLEARLGRNQAFMDINTIEPGVDFVEAIEWAVGECNVLIAVLRYFRRFPLRDWFPSAVHVRQRLECKWPAYRREIWDIAGGQDGAGPAITPGHQHQRLRNPGPLGIWTTIYSRPAEWNCWR
jgi:hypothetical protein